MSNTTGIEWTDAKWKVLDAEMSVVEKHLLDPLNDSVMRKPVVLPAEECEINRRARPRRIFVNSMSDLFNPNVPDEWIDRIFAVMALCPQHTFQVLTKRPERMLAYMTAEGCWHRIKLAAEEIACKTGLTIDYSAHRNPKWLDHVHLGVSVEDQKTADERIPLLLQISAAVRFLSCEPLLGPVQLLWEDGWGGADEPPLTGRAPRGDEWDSAHHIRHGGSRLDWVICGGESGPGARPMHPDWARGLRDQCVAAGVPFFFKQWGEWRGKRPEENLGLLAAGAKCHEWGGGVTSWRVGKKAAGSLLDGREWKEFPSSSQSIPRSGWHLRTASQSLRS